MLAVDKELDIVAFDHDGQPVPACVEGRDAELGHGRLVILGGRAEIEGHCLEVYLL